MSARVELKEVVFSTLMLAAVTVMCLAPSAYLPMLARAFVLQWAMVFLVIAGFALWMRRSIAMVAALICALVSLTEVTTPTGARVGAASGRSLSVAHMNVWQPNTSRQRAIESALATRADVLSVQEVDRIWAGALVNGLSRRFPYHRLVPDPSCYGIALFSRFPFRSVAIRHASGTPFVDAVIRVNGDPVRVLAVHAPSPTSYAQFRRRNAQLGTLAEEIRAMDLPTVVVGDLNTVHWDPEFVRMCTRSGAVPVTGPEVRTWPTLGPMALIPLDHVLIAGGITAEHVNTFEIPGSDHRGLVSNIILPEHAR